MAAEEPSSRKTGRNGLTETDMAAAHQLMELSDEDNNISISSSKRKTSTGEEEVNQRVISDTTTTTTTLAKIEEIFGKDEVYRPKKRRKYRSLVNIYMTTTPIVATANNVTNMRAS